MSSVILFLIITLLIKRGMIDRRGFNDVAKVFSTIAVVVFLVSLFATPLLFVLAGVGIIAGIIALVNKYSKSEKTDILRAHADEFQQLYNQVYQDELERIRRQRDAGYERGNATEKRARELAEERMARENAARFVENQIRKKYGDGAVPNSSGQFTPGGYTQAPTGQPNTAQGPVFAAAPGAAPNAGRGQGQPQPKPIKSSILPKATGRRTKIVNKFNEMYNLYLTEEQVRNIVAASYMSNSWKREVEAMYAKYDSVYQWLVGDTAYLRAYLRAFAVQDVTSDFQQQQKIVTESFEEIFQYSDTISGLSLERRIEMINSKFLTNFDDITYMIAYRYLETMGFHHELEKTQLNRIDGTFDDLVAKYDSMSTEEVDAGLAEVAGQAAAAASIPRVSDEDAEVIPPGGVATGGGAN
ncbi:MAG: hypothetical protein K5673_02160 [Lachnospiraceae bacterium]|nr:hypothetical protein [Lachnospiraceae bacterium]